MPARRSFVAWLGSLPLVGRPRPLGAAPPIVIDATPTALYQQPDGRNNLVRVAVMGVDAPAARARVTDRRGTLVGTAGLLPTGARDRKSTRLNSSHGYISYAVFCLKKKKKKRDTSYRKSNRAIIARSSRSSITHTV